FRCRPSSQNQKDRCWHTRQDCTDKAQDHKQHHQTPPKQHFHTSTLTAEFRQYKAFSDTVRCISALFTGCTMSFSSLNQNLVEAWHRYQHPLVRQLAFAVGSPNILSGIPEELELIHRFELHDSQTWQQYLSQYHPRLEFLDQHPEELIEFVQQLKSTRLGLRFEMLVWFWLLDD